MLVSLLNSLALAVLAASQLAAAGADEKAPEQLVRSGYQRILTAYEQNWPQNPEALQAEVRETLRHLLDLERLAPQLLHKHWQKMTPYDRQRFVEALTNSLTRKVMDEIAAYSQQSRETVPELRIAEVERKRNASSVKAVLQGPKSEKKLTFSILHYADGRLKITDIEVGGKKLRSEYYRFCKKILDDYSPTYLIAELNEDDYVILENFEGGEVGQLPPGWTWKKSDNDKNKPYKIVEENGNKYLQARDNGESVILGKEVKWNLRKYPYISFRWRVHKIPAGGDERYGKTNDSAAAVYIIYKKKFGLIPESVKFLWSTTLPVGAYTRRSGTGRPWNIVVESGEKHLGEWRTYTFNAYEAYKKTFGGKPPDRPVGIAILSDANSTHSQAYADYDDIMVLKKANADSGARKHLQAE